jgi:hypothetical protein
LPAPDRYSGRPGKARGVPPGRHWKRSIIMKLDHFVCGIVLAAATSAALAQQAVATGRVETVYVRESRNLFIEKKLLKRSENKELWAEVRIENPLSKEYVTELAKLPDAMAVDRGDLVETAISESTLLGVAQFAPVKPFAVSAGLMPFPEVNRVTALVAKHDTLRAMLFGLNNSRPRGNLGVEAQACTEVMPTALAYWEPNLPQTLSR